MQVKLNFLQNYVGQVLKMQKEFLDLQAQIWGEVYQEYLEVRK